MTVEINIPPAFQALADGVKQVDVSCNTVGECLEELVKQHPALKEKIFTGKGKLPKGMNIFINGASAFPGPLARPVRDGDKVHVAYIVLGG
jgi:molybdopterin converting factor small subunit